MKIDARGAAKALAEAGKWRVILLHGEDTGLIRERAARAVTVVAESLDDPFRVAALDRDAHDRLEEETGALSLIGGRRAVWVREGGDSLLPGVQRALAVESDTLVVIEAPGLASRSRLRAALEAEKRAAVIGCYPEEGRALAASVGDMLAAENVRIDRDALVWLTGHLGADRAAVRGEIAKLALYAGPGGALTLDDVQDCIGDAGGATLEDATSAALAGDRAAADLALERALADGIAPVGVARGCLSALTRLLRVVLAVESGVSRAEAVKALRPPVFFKRAERFDVALDRWNGPALRRALAETQALELACKQTGSPDLVLCRRHVAMLSAGPRALPVR
ncbi:DNA polymerase III subunit delta [Acidomonas methanolica]|uniref:DNA-directed DNA polymerase n=1 Tax=Acidomonas methanolica NBRC 104435 TaxID=1231351 RepID=A0A023D743_ACIMT|nr:DNA polymerase III subunit delta [Acidomonas methanolica]MBU2654663.1 DNA polymerase III subunit delta [Acidomonas methanolica]TCS27336.1 DNA polymerase III delta subunit [Acidomonas methanolica]GAJ29987.1 DNA polymerase III subunit delta [Acidomonas methanolica NBRC 104435]GEK99639.1 DNA polymerase III subunit delta [Acidomonas methanolica NBRC 104435]